MRALVLVLAFGVLVMPVSAKERVAQALMMRAQGGQIPHDLEALFRSGAAVATDAEGAMPAPPEHRPGERRRPYFEGVENDLPERRRKR